MDTIDKINFYLTQMGEDGASLSRALGLSNSAYSQWNTRKHNPSKRLMPGIAAFLGVEVKDLLPDNAPVPPATSTPGLSAELRKLPNNELLKIQAEIAAILIERAES